MRQEHKFLQQQQLTERIDKWQGFSVPIIGQSAASGAQVIDGSLKFDGNKQHYLTRTPSSSGNLKTWTWSGWVKRLEDTEGVRNQNLVN